MKLFPDGVGYFLFNARWEKQSFRSPGTWLAGSLAFSSSSGSAADVAAGSILTADCEGKLQRGLFHLPLSALEPQNPLPSQPAPFQSKKQARESGLWERKTRLPCFPVGAEARK